MSFGGVSFEESSDMGSYLESDVRAPVLVAAVGNILRRDDGVADAVLTELEREFLPSEIELYDVGTSAIDLMEIFSGRRLVVVIDAVRGGQEPGTVYRFGPEEVENHELPMNSLHQVGLLETLRLAELVDAAPEKAIVIGVQPGDTGLGIGLTPAVRDAVDKAKKLVLQELQNFIKFEISYA